MDREQELVNIVFQIAFAIQDKRNREHFDSMDDDQFAEWVRRQLRECGFPTHPVGSSWGMLDQD